MTPTAWVYVAYLVICVGITIWVARTLRKQGVRFLTAGQTEGTETPEALSHLLSVGFYLVNLGVISFLLKSADRVRELEDGIEHLSEKVGVILVAIGIMHFIVLSILAQSRRNTERETRATNHLERLRKLQEAKGT